MNNTDVTDVCQLSREHIISLLLIAGLKPHREEGVYMWEDPTDKFYWYLVKLDEYLPIANFELLDAKMTRKVKWKVSFDKVASNLTLARYMARNPEGTS
jgi:Leu/Phe-tRNA-protein transferase